MRGRTAELLLGLWPQLSRPSFWDPTTPAKGVARQPKRGTAEAATQSRLASRTARHRRGERGRGADEGSGVVDGTTPARRTRPPCSRRVSGGRGAWRRRLGTAAPRAGDRRGRAARGVAPTASGERDRRGGRRAEEKVGEAGSGRSRGADVNIWAVKCGAEARFKKFLQRSRFLQRRSRK